MARIDEVYKRLLKHIIDHGYDYGDPNRKNVVRKEIQSCQLTHTFEDGFPVLTTKKIYWKAVVGELLWFLRGDTNIKYLVDNGINIWNKDAANFSDNGDCGRIYGAQWRNWNPIGKRGAFGIDQIKELIKGLKENPMGTRHLVTAWNPAELDNMALPPCHWSFEILVRPLTPIEQLELADKTTVPYKTDKRYSFILKWHQRSVDVFLGLPFNIASYALLAQIIGKMTNMVPEGIIGDLSNVHIYYPHMTQVLKQLERGTSTYRPPNLNISEGFEDECGLYNNKQLSFTSLIERMEINDFSLKNYKSYPAIPAEMLAYDNGTDKK